MGILVRFPSSSRPPYGGGIGANTEIHQSIRQILLMLELQMLQISGLIAVCPAGPASATLQQRHDQLLDRIAVVRRRARALAGD